MGVFIEDLLSFSRLGRKELQKTIVDNEQLLEEILHEIQNDTQQRAEIKIISLFPSFADYTLIRQVWVNLLSNAIKYSGKKEKPVIEIGSSILGNEILYYIKDNGAGFNMKYADKLFGVFQRLHNPKEFVGTGIGLAIVHQVITRHGGKVWAESKINEGATFYFTLPNTK
jgi:light-regulated signal transduction histidine kinase (bacteriophytochrome)